MGFSSLAEFSGWREEPECQAQRVPLGVRFAAELLVGVGERHKLRVNMSRFPKEIS
jgi:hypothetical protein